VEKRRKEKEKKKIENFRPGSNLLAEDDKLTERKQDSGGGEKKEACVCVCK